MYSESETRNNYCLLTKLLIDRKLTVSTMESATSGQIASLITDTEGASSVLKGAFVTYCNEAKIMQGVPAETIEKYGVYSKETAVAMAKACAERYSADIGIGITGTMGNTDPVNPENSFPGQVYFAVKYNDRTVSFFRQISVQPSRLMYKLAVAEEIYSELMLMLK